MNALASLGKIVTCEDICKGMRPTMCLAVPPTMREDRGRWNCW